MFWILCDPSSGSTELCLTEITRSDSQIFCRVLGRCLADPKQVGVIFNFVSFKLLYNVDFNL